MGHEPDEFAETFRDITTGNTTVVINGARYPLATLPARSGWRRAGTLRRLSAVGGALATGLAVMAAQAPSALTAPGALTAQAAAATPAPQVRWQACPQYSDAVLAALGFSDIAGFRTLWARTQCGTTPPLCRTVPPTSSATSTPAGPTLGSAPAPRCRHRLGRASR
jgi:hypothetical protein